MSSEVVQGRFVKKMGLAVERPSKDLITSRLQEHYQRSVKRIYSSIDICPDSEVWRNQEMTWLMGIFSWWRLYQSRDISPTLICNAQLFDAMPWSFLCGFVDRLNQMWKCWLLKMLRIGHVNIATKKNWNPKWLGSTCKNPMETKTHCHNPSWYQIHVGCK